MKKYKAASILLIIHGGLFEIGYLSLIIFEEHFKTDTIETAKYFSFFVPYFSPENLFLMLIKSGIIGIMKIISAIGLLKNRMWGFVLALINCIVTMVFSKFMFNTWIIDGILSCTVLVILLIEYFGKKEIA